MCTTKKDTILYLYCAFVHACTNRGGYVSYKYKEKLRILSSIRDQRTQKQGTKGTAKTREVLYTCRYANLIPN